MCYSYFGTFLSMWSYFNLLVIVCDTHMSNECNLYFCKMSLLNTLSLQKSNCYSFYLFCLKAYLTESKPCNLYDYAILDVPKGSNWHFLFQYFYGKF